MNSDLPVRAPIYAWLAERLVREVNAEDWADCRQEPLRSILIRSEPSLEDHLASALSPAHRLALEEEFARLFLMPGGVSPMASAWVATPDDREATRQNIADWIGRSLTALGRESIDRDPWGKLPLDHLAVVLDLVAVAAKSTDPDESALAELLEKDLLGPALVGFGAALRSESKAPFYRAMGHLIGGIAVDTQP